MKVFERTMCVMGLKFSNANFTAGQALPQGEYCNVGFFIMMR